MGEAVDTVDRVARSARKIRSTTFRANSALWRARRTIDLSAMPTVDLAATVLARFGGAGLPAQVLCLDRSAVHRWALPKHRGGSGALIPARHHQREQGIALSPTDLVGTPMATGDPPRAGADDG